MHIGQGWEVKYVGEHNDDVIVTYCTLCADFFLKIVISTIILHVRQLYSLFLFILNHTLMQLKSLDD